MSIKKSFDKRKITGKKLVFGSLLEVIIDTDKFPEGSDQRIENWSADVWERSAKDMMDVFRKKNIQHINEIVVPAGADPNKFRKEYKEVSQLTLEEAKNFLRVFIPEQVKATKLPEEFKVAHFDQIRALARKVNEDTGENKVGSLEIDDSLWKVKNLNSENAILANKEHALKEKDRRYVEAESARFLNEVGDALSRGKFDSNPSISQYPSAIVETKDKSWSGHAELHPLDTQKEIDGMPIPEEALVKAMQDIAKSLKTKGFEADTVSRHVISLWLDQKDRTGWATISLDEICERAGLKRRSDKDGQSRFDTKQRDSVRGGVERAARVLIKIKDLPGHLKRERRIKLTDPFIQIRNRISPQDIEDEGQSGVSGELWGTEKWERIVVQPGAIMIAAIEEFGRQYMLLPTGLYSRLKGYQDRNAQLLGMKLHQVIRFKASDEGKKKYSFRIKTLLDYADITSDVKAEKRLIKALDTCSNVSVGAIKGYKLPKTLTQIKTQTNNKRVTSNVIKYWENEMIEVEVPSNIYELYSKIRQKKLTTDAKNRN